VRWRPFPIPPPHPRSHPAASPHSGPSRYVPVALAKERPPPTLGGSDPLPTFRRARARGKSAMKAAARLPWFDANAARAPLPIARPTARAIFARERRTVTGQSDRSHGKARRAYAACRLGAGRLSTGADHKAVSVPITPSFAGDTTAGRRSGLDPPFTFRYPRRLSGTLGSENALQD
jgi:hypothetical protein